MSLASAQRALAQANRDTLKKTAKGAIGKSLIESFEEGITDVYDIANEAFDIEGNVNAWSDYEEGQRYLGIEDPNKPMKLSQKYFKRPSDVYKDPIDILGTRNKSFTTGDIGHIGALARSDLSESYTMLLGGDLSSKLGTQLNAIPDPEKTVGETGMPGFNTFVTPDEKERRLEAARSEVGLKGGSSLVPSYDVKAYDSTESPNYSDLPPISTQSMTDEWKNYQGAASKSFEDKGLSHGKYGLGSKKGNQAIAAALNEKGIKGSRLSTMIPGWRDMEYEEKMEAIQSLGVGPEEMWSKMKFETPSPKLKLRK